MRPRLRVWLIRIGLFSVLLVLVFLLGVVPIGGSYLITNARFNSDAGVTVSVPFPLEDIEFAASDGIRLRGWWMSPEEEAPATVVMVHGLNRSRVEMLDRAEAMYDRGFSVLLFDLRNHGISEETYTTLGVRESRDVCAASAFARSRQPDAPVVLWGVSLGAAAALLGAECARAVAVVSDSSFLSVANTVRHHFAEIFRLPAFPIADILLGITEWRMGFGGSDGDVEAAVRNLREVPILFIAGGRDWRMPPDIAARLLAASSNTGSRMLLVEGATHGHAFDDDPRRCLDAVDQFLGEVLSPGIVVTSTPTLY